MIAAQAVDRFINGDFYLNSLSAKEILDRILQLRVSPCRYTCGEGPLYHESRLNQSREQLFMAYSKYDVGEFGREMLALQETRRREFFERMVSHLMARIIYHETRKYFSKNVFCRHTTRPWGRNKMPVSH